MFEEHSTESALTPAVSAPAAFDLSSLAYLQASVMTVTHPVTGQPTTWKITIAGPGHPRTVALQDEVSRRIIDNRNARDEAMANGRKWTAPKETPASNTKSNSRNLAQRIIDWTPVVLQTGGPEVHFDPDDAARLLADPNYGWLYEQIRKFLNEDAGFIKDSPQN